MTEKKPHCSRCHRALTDPFSIAVGMGPECRGGLQKKGWKFPKPKYKVKNGRVTMIGMSGKVEAPIGDLTARSKELERNIGDLMSRSKALERKSKKLLKNAEEAL